MLLIDMTLTFTKTPPNIIFNDGITKFFAQAIKVALEEH